MPRPSGRGAVPLLEAEPCLGVDEVRGAGQVDPVRRQLRSFALEARDVQQQVDDVAGVDGAEVTSRRPVIAVEQVFTRRGGVGDAVLLADAAQDAQESGLVRVSYF